MPTLNPLRSAIVGLGLFAGMASAQAALTITFEENVENEYLTIYFSGQTTTPFATTQSYISNMLTVSGGTIVVAEPNEGEPYYATPAGFGWTIQDMLWLSGSADEVVSNSGTGGFVYSETFGSIHVEILSTTYAAANELIIWDGHITYLGSLADLGLNDGQSGTIIFTNDGASISVNWSATATPVPEPTTYALVLGLGIAGIALVRRRRASR